MATKKRIQKRVKSPLLKFVPITFDVPQEVKTRLEELAKESGISFSQVAQTIFFEQLEKHQDLVSSIPEKVNNAFDEKYNLFEEELARINAPTEKLNRLLLELFPSLKSKLKKEMSN